MIIKKAVKTALEIVASGMRSSRSYAELDSVSTSPSPKILIIACHWIGDTLWATQIVPYIYKLYPECFLACITKPTCKPLWTGKLAVNQIFESNAIISDRMREKTSWLELHNLGRKMKKQMWDLIIDLTGNRYSALFSHWCCARHTLGFDGGEFGRLYSTRVKSAENTNKHLSERPFRVIEPLLKKFAYSTTITPPTPEENYHKICKQHNINSEKPLAIIAPCAGWKEKEWGDDNFTKIATTLLKRNFEVIFTGSISEKERLEKAAKSAGTDKTNIKIIAKETISSAITLISKCNIFIGNDSGLGHIAAAMKKKTITVFTKETCPNLCRPIGENVIIINTTESKDAFIETTKRINNINIKEYAPETPTASENK